MLNKKVLIAEDDVIISLDLSRYLKNLDYESIIVRSGEDLIDQHKTMKPGLVISDLNLGGKIPVEEALQQINKRDQTPVIIISGASTSRIEKITKTLSPCSYLKKPFDNEELFELIKRYL